jgi:hypothetical protein
VAQFKAGDIAIYQNLTDEYAPLNNQLADVKSNLAHCDGCGNDTYWTNPVGGAVANHMELMPGVFVRLPMDGFCTLPTQLRPLGEKGTEDVTIHGRVISDDNSGMDISLIPAQKVTS